MASYVEKRVRQLEREDIDFAKSALQKSSNTKIYIEELFNWLRNKQTKTQQLIAEQADMVKEINLPS